MATSKSREQPLALPQDAVEAIQTRLRRVEGQVRAIQTMLEERRDCHAIAQQMAAAKSALERAMVQLMTQSMVHCIDGDRRNERELARLTDTFCKLLS